MTRLPTATEGDRATRWLERHLAAGRALAAANVEEFRLSPGLALGALALVPKSSPPQLRVVSAMIGREVTLWDFGGPRTFLIPHPPAQTTSAQPSEGLCSPDNHA